MCLFSTENCYYYYQIQFEEEVEFLRENLTVEHMNALIIPAIVEAVDFSLPCAKTNDNFEIKSTTSLSLIGPLGLAYWISLFNQRASLEVERNKREKIDKDTFIE